MKRMSASVVVAAGAAALLAGCGEHPDAPPERSTRLSLRGRVVAVATTSSAAGANLSQAGAPVAKVLVYRDFGDADVVPVDSAGRFAVDVERKACGLVFLDAADRVVGYLSLASGISALPLMLVDSAVTLVDLSTIAIQDSVGTPAHDPTGSGGEAAMTAEEREAYRLQSALFSAIVRNLDMNDDGVIDVLSARPYWVGFGADFDGGLAPTSDPGSGGPMPVLNVFHFGFSDYSLAAGSVTAQLAAPDGRVFALHEATPYTIYRDRQPQGTATMYHWVLQNTSWDALRAGTYGITYSEGAPVSLRVTDPLNGAGYIVAVRVWYEMAGGRITRVHWRWAMLDGRPVDASRLLRRDMHLGFTYGINHQVTHADVTPADTQHDVDIDTTGLQAIMLWATDLFGNNQITNYRVR